jgi:hypothetical protein
MVLNLGNNGIKSLPEEDAVVSVLRHSTQKPGFYVFPGMKDTTGMTVEEKEATQKELLEKYRTGPSGVLVYHPMGKEPFSPLQIAVQLLGDIIASLLAAIFLSKAIGALHGFWTRVLFVSLLGLFASVVIDLPYWNWYSFPTDFALSSLLEQLIGFTLVGITLSWLMNTPDPKVGNLG